MKAIVQDVYGSVEVLELRDVEAPVPGDDDVLIRVRAAGVDQGVWHLMTGGMLSAFGPGMRCTAPARDPSPNTRAPRKAGSR
jgi:NADPH:quinone reductase-like Zn-dependent oxidoreductase